MNNIPLPKIFSILMLAVLLLPCTAQAERIKDVADVEGIRSNALIGYGIVVGLNGTGDSATAAPFSVYSIMSMLERMGVSLRDKVSVASLKPKNIAAVMVTAELLPFARPGQELDVNISSIGDSKSLRGGTLLITPLLGGDGRIYAYAQGSMSVGGFSASGKGKDVVKNHPTSGRIPNGARIEIAAPNTLQMNQPKIVLNLRQPDFTTAGRMAASINSVLGDGSARALNSGSVEVNNPSGDAVGLISMLEAIEVTTDHPAVVVMDEKTGTIVMGSEVRIDTVAVAHGNISVSVTESPQVSQPKAFAAGSTTTVDRTDVKVNEEDAQLVVLPKKVSLSDLVAALNSVGATPSDLIAVLQAIKAAGALHAELRVL
ncbi:MAG: flagellar biosynthesis protein FlgA [Zetaproteobacteria bacterium CG06_land_8_20_14_3_00_59_53]|nr:MAG: flagellar biosynthesis protein FlgA [Zetaproteobacteria bacterium CG2_30_59_37]PIO88744.1 MAG: flagellar biosynthesis protein FlgA [Zetaproteobacteria bacterium CG23_combo_of_CG06-09_8_20_14_all_59_86]PIQ65419.1 MAG: flagellar biosynthesis protein FlgA [Zetaproteobacteria bacterium CG11_big_fil_rev_8_21_14_0_20_59_439]PIU69671.1 MAG: flagellar biosynthesis protein FlgA [Zetaproteobacteria bacterium CG06_land_8_20_14_3_00_59_53]PIU96917.1 MAG: flagellar biosynthesis protein FlgA [Zetapro